MTTEASPSDPMVSEHCDYPAAHSMDSTWWAVDRHGHLGYFATGEAGAMPAELGEESSAELTEVLISGGLPFYCDDLFEAADGKLYSYPYRFRRKPAEEPAEVPNDGSQQYFDGYLLWLRDEQALRALADVKPAQQRAPTLIQRVTRLFSPLEVHSAEVGWTLHRLNAAGKVVVWISRDISDHFPPLYRVRELIASGTILRGWAFEPSLDMWRFGIYEYGLGTFDNWIAGPFERETFPPLPIRIDQLPGEIASAATRLKLANSDFGRDALLQPFEHVASYSWGQNWVSTTGKLFPSERHGPELDGLTLSQEPALDGVATKGAALVELVAAYLRGDAGAAGILCDYLEERGQPRVEDESSMAARLDEVLLKLLPERTRLAVETDFLAHALANSSPPESAITAAQAVIAALRNLARGQGSNDDLTKAGQAAMHAWAPGYDDEELDVETNPLPDTRVAWAAWALAQRLPLVAARTTRLLGPDELRWQCEFALQALETG